MNKKKFTGMEIEFVILQFLLLNLFLVAAEQCSLNVLEFLRTKKANGATNGNERK